MFFTNNENLLGIFKWYIGISVLIIFYTFYAFIEDATPLLCGFAAFSSIFLVLALFARQITEKQTNPVAKRGLRGLFALFSAFLLKYMVPGFFLWVGVVEKKDPLAVGLGCFLGLATASVAMWIQERKPN